MAKNLLVISVETKETRVALIENGIIAELHLERSGNKDAGSVGDVVLGKVTRVLPGLQAAFIDIGQERAAFLHVEDLIRPDDFDAYLAGGRKSAKEDNAAAAPEVTGDEELDAELDAELKDAPPPAPTLEVSGAPAGSGPDLADELRASDEVAEAAQDGAVDDGDDRASVEALDDADDRDSDGGDEEGDDDRDDETDDGDGSSGDLNDGAANDRDASQESLAAGAPDARTSAPTVESLEAHEAPVAAEPAPAAAGEAPRGETPPRGRGRSGRPPRGGRASAPPADDLFALPGFTVSDPGDPTPKAPARPRAGEAGAAAGGDRRREGGRDGGRDGGRRRGRGGSRGREGGSGREGGRSSEARSSSGRDGRGRSAGGNVPGRISKTTPIRDVVREGQEIIVQVSKDPIGTKGARCTSHISLPGRYVVYLPTVDHTGVSKRIGSDKERARLRETIESMKPPSGGLIVRTVAEGLTKKQLKADVGYLVRLWGEIAKKREGARAPTQLSSELDLVLKTARDLFTDEVHQVVIDDKHQYDRLCHFVEMFMPERLKDILFYSGEEPIFDAYGIEDEIARALSRKVPLPSGGHLVIDQAEALTAIDVNTGRFVGKGSKDMEETILKTNLEAVNEIAYQLRFRNIGGLIILDLIDMDRHGNREKVRRTLEELLQKDKAKTTLNRISDLGLIEMTRKRTRESLGRLMHEPCFYCDGTGQLQSKETIAYEILREIRRRRGDLPGYTIVVHAHPAVADILQTTERDAVADAENRYMRKITVIPRTEYHLEQFDLAGK
jgi:ribonuclease G